MLTNRVLFIKPSRVASISRNFCKKTAKKLITRLWTLPSFVESEANLTSILIPWLVFTTALPLLAAGPPTVGEKAPDFTLSAVDGQSLRLSDLTAKGPVALIVLRGYPGYQCPYCNRQVQDFIQKSQEFADAGVPIVMIYPGPPQSLNTKANEFLADKKIPENFHLLLDPGYQFTNLYGLRWDAPHETAYPATFLLDRQGVIFFSKIVKEHGGRTTASEVLDALPKSKAVH